MCNRLACVEVVGAGTAIEFVCDHGVKMSLGGICPGGTLLFCHVRVESGAEAIRVTFYRTKREREKNISEKTNRLIVR